MSYADSRLESLVIVWVWLYTIQLTATSTMNFKTRAATEETWVCYKFRKNRRFQDSVKSTLPLLASSMFMADLSMRIISHLYMGKIQARWQKNTLKQHRIGNLKIFTGKEAYRTQTEVIASCGKVWCSLFETEDLFGVYFSLLKHNESTALWRRFQNEGVVCD